MYGCIMHAEMALLTNQPYGKEGDQSHLFGSRGGFKPTLMNIADQPRGQCHFHFNKRVMTLT